MKELDSFEQENGFPLKLGMRVTIHKSNPYAQDWLGYFLVLGIQWDHRKRQLNITLGENLDDPGTDGWKVKDLVPNIG